MEKYSKSKDLFLFNKTTKLMNHLGGMERMGYVEWLHKARGTGEPCVSHLWMATQETKRFEMSNVEKLQVQPLGIMGSAMILGCWNLVFWTVGGRWDDRLERVHLTKERLLKDQDMSLVKDNLSIKTWKLQESHHSNFKIKLVGEQG